MSELKDGAVVREFRELDIEVKLGSSVLDRLQEIGRHYHLDANQLCNEWVAYSAQNDDCELVEENIEKWESTLHVKSRQTPTTSRRGVSKTRRRGGDGGTMYTQDDLGDIFGDDDEANLFGMYGTPEDKAKMVSKTRRRGGDGGTIYTQDDLGDIFGFGEDDEANLFGMYGTPEDKAKIQRGQKRQQTTPTTPGPPSTKSRLTQNGATPTQNGATPTTPRTTNGVHSSTPYKSMVDRSMLSSTPAAKYDQRQNRGGVVCTLNDALLPRSWRGTGSTVTVKHYSCETELKSPYQYMFQKVSEKALALLDRIEDFGREICHHNCLSDPLSVAQPSLEPAVFTGQVLCEGEGHLNARSCLLEGPVKSIRSKGCCVKMEIPDNVPCSLFPGQVVAVEGINNYHGLLIPSKIYDEGIIPPLPVREVKSVTGFTMIAATGPFTTSDNLEMGALRDLMEVVKQEKTDLLILLGPFVDSVHPQIKECNIPGDLTFDEFFKKQILSMLHHTVRSQQTKLVLVPSQRDVHHPWAVYPQPPFKIPSNIPIFSTSDPSTLTVNGLCLGLTSTDILFHLSARTMFRGPTGDRMARLARLVLSQQCYHPLLPAFRREDHSNTPGPATQTMPTSTTPTTSVGKASPSATRAVGANGTSSGGSDGSSILVQPKDELTDVNLDLVHALDIDFHHAMLPARPDILLLPSDLKPFAKDFCLSVDGWSALVGVFISNDRGPMFPRLDLILDYIVDKSLGTLPTLRSRFNPLRIEGCVCINPGRLTKKASGGTFVKVFVPDAPTIKDDFSSDIAVQIVYI